MSDNGPEENKKTETAQAQSAEPEKQADNTADQDQKEGRRITLRSLVIGAFF